MGLTIHGGFHECILHEHGGYAVYFNWTHVSVPHKCYFINKQE